MKKALLILTILSVGAGSVLAYTASQRSDCPGQKTCPLNGNLICKDLCPLGE